MATLTADISLSISGAYTGVNDLGVPSMPLSIRNLAQIASGTASGQADLMFADRRHLAGSATESLDLAGGLTDPFGAALTFAKIKGLFLFSLTENANNIIVGAAASNAWAGPFGATTHTVTVQPGGLLAIVAPKTGWAVTAGTGDLLKIANAAAGSIDYDLVLIGTSA